MTGIYSTCRHNDIAHEEDGRVPPRGLNECPRRTKLGHLKGDILCNR